MECPHCHETIKRPPLRWQHKTPLHCSHCAGLIGFGEKGPFPIPRDFKPLAPLFSWQEAKRFCFYAEGRSYVYFITNSDGVPFYVGTGKGYRVCSHLDESYGAKRLTEKNRIILKLNETGEGEWYFFAGIYSDPVKARSREQQLIDKLGRRPNGMLANRAKDRLIDRESIESEPLPRFEPINERVGQRMVYHPDLIEPTEETENFNCKVCGSACLVPLSLVTKRVQCPHCAHLWKPL